MDNCILVCNLAEDDTGLLATVKKVCSECGNNVVSTEASLAAAGENATIVCINCVMPIIKDDKNPNIQMPTSEQLKELKDAISGHNRN